MNFKQTLGVLSTTIGLGLIPNTANAAIIGVDFGPSASSTPTNWTLVTGAGTTNDLIDETGAATNVDITVNSTGTIGSFSANVLANTIPTHSNPLDNIGGNLFDFGSDPLVVTFSDLVPNQSYSYWLFGVRDGSTGMNQNVVVNGVSFNQTAASEVLGINDELGDNTRTLESYAISITADALGQIVTTVTPNTELYSLAGIAIEEVEIPPTPEPASILGLMTIGAGLVASKRKKQG